MISEGGLLVLSIIRRSLYVIYTHKINPPSHISSLAASLIQDSQQRDPTLTVRDLSIGKGSGVAIGAVDKHLTI